MIRTHRVLKVRSRRNSECGSGIPFDRLDWSEWWTDNTAMPEYVYLHVPHLPDPEWGGTVHRIRPKFPAKRLMMKRGDLYWIVDDETVLRPKG